MSIMNHPNIVEKYDYKEDENSYLIIMELC